MTNLIDLYPNYITNKLRTGQVAQPLQDYDYLLYTEACPDGQIVNFKQWVKAARKFGSVDNATAVSVQLPIDRSFFKQSPRLEGE